ncbi:MAG: hypothetical protein AAGU76_15375 [Sedimentibacter sp.]|uniref:hypothetical protein n=1 Tax=Sedimentibacter sp. TaxID=1960295 RepID=UPI0031598028
MDQKKNKTFVPLLMNLLKSKKGWFLLSTVIIFVTTLLIPYILKVDQEFFIIFGIVELFILVFLNCLIDNNFLHNESKLAYYKSKPVSIGEQMTVNIATNAIFTVFLLVLILLSVVFQGLEIEILDIFKIIVPWLAAGILLASLSSILAGNTMMAGAMTIFNFCLPLIIYLIINFVFTILEGMVAGFSAKVLMEYFVNRFYRIDYIYFVTYTDNPMDYVYFLLLGVILIGITLLIFRFLKRRKNENTGNFIVFDGYKYFVSVLASLILPAFYVVSSSNSNIAGKILVSVLMAMLSYYIIVAVMEKSFRISRLSLKVAAASMAAFVVLTGATVAFAGQYKDFVPDPAHVKMAYVGNNSWVFDFMDELDDDTFNSRDEFLKWQKERGLVLFTEKETIEDITQLHRELISNRYYKYEYYYLSNMVISYMMDDGSIIVRDYKVSSEGEQPQNDNKNELAYEILSSSEMIRNKYYYLFDEENYNSSTVSCFVNRYGNDGTIVNNVNFDEVRPYLIKDIENRHRSVLEKDRAFENLGIYYYDFAYEKEYSGEYYLQITDTRITGENVNNSIDNLNLAGFKNTLNYLGLE